MNASNNYNIQSKDTLLIVTINKIKFFLESCITELLKDKSPGDLELVSEKVEAYHILNKFHESLFNQAPEVLITQESWWNLIDVLNYMMIHLNEDEKSKIQTILTP